MVDPDLQALVIDNGGHTIKCGFAGDDSPRAIFPTLVGCAKNTEGLNKENTKNEYFVGSEAHSKRRILKMRNPIDRGMVKNWKDMERIWKHVFDDKLKVNPKDHPVLHTDVPFTPQCNRERMTATMFENFDVPAFYVRVSPLLSQYASGRGIGIIVDCGYGVSRVVPTYEGYVLPHAIKTMNLAGNEITSQVEKLLYKKGDKRTTSLDRTTHRDIKEKICYIALDSQKELEKAKKSKHCNRKYDLPDGSKLTIGTERFLAPGVAETITDSISTCDIDIRRDLYQNIILAGGSTLFNGIVERLQQNIKLLSPKNARVKVIGASDRNVSQWIGGSILASLSTFEKMWITRKEYEETGATIVHKKCFT